MKTFIFAFYYYKTTIEDKDEGFINLIFFEIVNAFDINEIRDDFNLKRLI